MPVLRHHQMYTVCIGILLNLLLSMVMPDWVYLILPGSETLFLILISHILPDIKESTPNRLLQQVFYIHPLAMYHSPMNSGTFNEHLILMNLLSMHVIQDCLQNIFQEESLSDSYIPT